MFKFSFDTVVYYGENVETMICRVAKYGYDGIELVGEPEQMNVREINELLKRYGIVASSICSAYNRQRDLISSDERVRRNAREYMKAVAKMASEVGAGVMTATPTTWEHKIYPEAEPEQEMDWAIAGLREVGRYALDLGVKLAVEPWNRYETYFINRLEQSLAIVEAVDLPNVGAMGDTFHMQIEEDDVIAAILKAGPKLVHMHLADSNRKAPGKGHMDFKAILKALKQVGYTGYLTMEILPAAGDPFYLLKTGRANEFYDEYTKFSIQYLRQIEREIESEERS